MKKSMLVLLLVGSLALAGGVAYAGGYGYGGHMGPGWGGHMGPGWGGHMMGPGWGGGPYGGYRGYGWSTKDRQAFAKFQRDSLQLRQQLAAKRLELRAMWSQPNPDQARITKLQTELRALYDQLANMRQKAGLPTWGRGDGRGPGWGRGPGYGPRYGRGYGAYWR